MNRHAAFGVVNARIKVEGSGEAEWQRRTKPNKLFDPTGMSEPLIVNLEATCSGFPAGQSRRWMACALESFYAMKKAIGFSKLCV